MFNFIYHIGSSVYVGCAATTVTNLVLPRMRAMAGAFFILTLSMIGLALGPYTLGRISDLFEYQGYAPGEAMQTSMALILFILLIPSAALFMAAKHLKEDEESVFVFLFDICLDEVRGRFGDFQTIVARPNDYTT